MGLEYEIGGSGFGWRRIAKGEKARYVMDDASKRTHERDELGDLDRTRGQLAVTESRWIHGTGLRNSIWCGFRMALG
jgi:hypothetical protein